MISYEKSIEIDPNFSNSYNRKGDLLFILN